MKNIIKILLINILLLMPIITFAQEQPLTNNNIPSSVTTKTVETQDRSALKNLGVNKKWKITNKNRDNVLRTPYVNSEEKIYDFSNVIDDAEEQELLQKINDFTRKHNTELIIVTYRLPYTSDSMNEDFAADFYDYNDFGLEIKDYDGIVLFRNTYEIDPYYDMYTFGKAQLHFDQTRHDDILDSIYSDMIKSENPKLILEVSLLNLFVEEETQIDPVKHVKTIEKSTNTNTNIETVVETKDVDKPKKKNNGIDNELIRRRIVNTIAKADKNVIKDIRSNWKKISELAFDEKRGNVARLMVSDIEPVAASDEYIVMKSKLNGISDQINSDLNCVEKILEIIFNNKYKAICVSEKDWNSYIELYKQDKSSFVYEKEETTKNKPAEKSLKEKAADLFED